MSRGRETVSAVAVALRNENVRRAELAWGASIVAEWAHFVALGVFAYRAGGTSAVGVAGLVRLLPAAIVAPVAASFGDRFRRERFLIVVLLVGAAALAGSAVASFMDLRAAVYAFAAVVGLSSTLIRPTLQALLPSLARTPEELIASNGASSTIESLGTLAGPLGAGLLVAVAPVGVVFAAAAAVAVAGAAVLARVRVEASLSESGDGVRKGVFRQSWSAFRAMVGLPAPRLVLGLMTAQTFVRGCLNVLIVVAVFQVLHIGAAAVGYMTAAIGVGGLVGALRGMTLRSHRLARPFALALVCWGVPIALIAVRSELILALMLLAIVGFANSVEDVAGFTLVQRAVADDALNRVLGVFWGVAMGAVALGSLAAPGLVRLVGARPAFLLVGSLLPLITLVTYRSLVRLDQLTAPGEPLRLIDRTPMFAPLSLATKERLAGRLIPVSVSAGECVIKAGDVGDRFYIVESGELEVDAGNRRSSAGDFFGEIALLRDVPRTATVTASTDSRLYALQRADFLAAVTGHSTAERLGHAIADARLSGVPTA
jgi:MFS family permease